MPSFIGLIDETRLTHPIVTRLTRKIMKQGLKFKKLCRSNVFWTLGPQFEPVRKLAGIHNFSLYWATLFGVIFFFKKQYNNPLVVRSLLVRLTCYTIWDSPLSSQNSIFSKDCSLLWDHIAMSDLLLTAYEVDLKCWNKKNIFLFLWLTNCHCFQFYSLTICYTASRTELEQIQMACLY